MNPLNKAIEILGSQAKLAAAINEIMRAEGRTSNIGQSHVYYWLQSGKVSAKYVLAIEKATGGHVPRHALRPDIYPPEEAPLVAASSLIRGLGDSLRVS